MKKLLTLLLAALLLVVSYFIGTVRGSDTISAPAAGWTNGSEFAQSWRELNIASEAAAARIFEATNNPRERIDGLAYLSQLWAAALEMKFSKGDQARPAFTDWMGDDRKLLGDSPDAVYHTAEISADYAYEVSGNRGSAEYFGLILYGRGLNGWNRPAANINHETITFSPEGDFRVVISPENPGDGRDWLPLKNDIHMVMARQYFHDRPGKTEARLLIKNLTPQKPEILSDAVAAKRLRAAITFFNDSLKGTLALSEMMIAAPNSSTPPKSYNQDFGGIFYPTEDNQYLGTWFAIEDDEALVIEGDAPAVDYWSISLQNRWLQSLDYENYQSSLDNHKIKTIDGRYRVIVAKTNPGVDNWLNSAGYNSGHVAIRYQLAGKIPLPEMRVVKLADLK